MRYPAKWLCWLFLFAFLGGCATTPTPAPETVVTSAADSGDFILVLASSRSPTMESRFASLATALNDRATLEADLEPYFAVRQPTTVRGVQLVYGLVDGEFGMRQDLTAESLLRREYPDLRWIQLSR